MADLKAQIEIGADVSGVEAGIGKAKRSINSLGVAVQDANSKAGKSIDRYVQSLQQQAATLGKSSREIELYKLGLRGASEAQLKAADTALKLREGYEKGQIAGARLRAGFLALGAAAATGLIAATVAFDSLLKKAGDFQDMAEKFGDTGENFASLAVAAGTAGVAMDTVGAATAKLTKGLTGVDDESKAAGAAVAALGLNLASFKQLAPTDQLEQVAKALGNFEDGAAKTAVAMALFGKSGAELLPFLKELGAEGGRQVILTQRQIELADEYSDKQARLRTEISLHAQAIATELLPAVNEFSATVADLVKDQEFAATATAVLKGALAGAVTIFQTIAVVASDVGFVFKGVGREVGAIAAQLDALRRLDFKGFAAISNAVREDGARARAELDRFQAKVMSIGQATTPPIDPSFQSLENRRLAPKTRPQLKFDGAAKAGGANGKSKADQEAKEQLRADIQAIKDASIARVAAFDTAESIMESRRNVALISEAEYYEAKRAFIRLDADEKNRALQAEIARLEQEKLSGKDAIANKREIEKLNAQIARNTEDATGKIEVLTNRQTEAVQKLKTAYEDARIAAGEYLSAIAKRNQREIEGIGQGDKARGQRQEANSIEDKFLDEKSKLDRDLRRNDITREQYSEYLEIARSTYEAEVALYRQRNADMDAAQSNWANGFNEAAANYIDDARNISKQSQTLFEGVFGSLEDAFVKFTQTGKLSFKDLFNSIAADISRMAFKQMLGDMLGGLKASAGDGGALGSIASAIGLKKPDAAAGGQSFGKDVAVNDVSSAQAAAASAISAASSSSSAALASLTNAATIAANALTSIAASSRGSEVGAIPGVKEPTTGDFARMDRGQTTEVVESTADVVRTNAELAKTTDAGIASIAALAQAAGKGGGALSMLPSIINAIQVAAASSGASSGGSSGAGIISSLISAYAGGGDGSSFTTNGGYTADPNYSYHDYGYSEGGYTGDIGATKPAGVVHGNEYVFSAPAVKTIGVAALEQMHQKARKGATPSGLPGYTDGGYVTGDRAPQMDWKPYGLSVPTKERGGETVAAGDTNISVAVAMPPGGSRDTAMQFGANVGRQIRVASRRNG